MGNNLTLVIQELLYVCKVLAPNVKQSLIPSKIFHILANLAGKFST
ncbi:hypothetical protein TPHV1_210040 [Treponema phagedenis]|uniref:Uncharacterized protein n=1 Tax=Treponema phagedenis TaxID=162 RepID=A0A0B7GW74_TREPH|nr:hypothetical protein TPHV1_210040 [Treponema phagedenis]